MAAATRSPRGSSTPVSGSTDRKAAQRVQDALHRPEPICDRAAQRLAVPSGSARWPQGMSILRQARARKATSPICRKLRP